MDINCLVVRPIPYNVRDWGMGDARVELATSTMSRWHSPTELTARFLIALVLYKK